MIDYLSTVSFAEDSSSTLLDGPLIALVASSSLLSVDPCLPTMGQHGLERYLIRVFSSPCITSMKPTPPLTNIRPNVRVGVVSLVPFDALVLISRGIIELGSSSIWKSRRSGYSHRNFLGRPNYNIAVTTYQTRLLPPTRSADFKNPYAMTL